ncbi:MAG: phasin family protein [Chitinivibrionales bacterium]
MLEIIKKSLLIGIGMAAVTKERAEEMVKGMLKDTDVSASEGKKIIDEVLKKTEETRASIEKMINDRVQAALNRLDVPTRKEMRALEERVIQLENKMLGADKV